MSNTRIAQNGYHYTKTEEHGWRLTHHIVAEKVLGRPLNDNERVSFKDKDRSNLSPDNIVVNLKGKTSVRQRLARLEAKRDEINAEIEHCKRELELEER